eukprot:m.33533 g.33533  ORF g.33533 m.33533 type:complete len:463 (+) comp9869_c0_seq1:16-1404(+)
MYMSSAKGAEDQEEKSSNGRCWSPPLEGLIFLLLFSISAFIPAQTEFIQQKICVEKFGHLPSNSDLCDSAEITSETSMYILYLKLAETIPSLFVATTLGPMSDQYGRKPVLLLSTFGMLILSFGYLLVACLDWPKVYLFVFETLFSVCGSSALLLMAFFSCVVDTVPFSSRTVRMAALEGVLYLGLVAGMLGGGYVSTRFGYIDAFLLINVVTVVCVIYVLCMVETLPLRNRRIVSIREANIVHIISNLFKKKDEGLLALFFTFQVMNKIGLIPVFVLFLKHQFHWNDGFISYFLAGDNLSKALALLVVVPVVSRCVPRVKRDALDLPMLRSGAVATLVGYVVVGAQPILILPFIYIALGPISGLPIPLVRSILSKRYSDTKQVGYVHIMCLYVCVCTCCMCIFNLIALTRSILLLTTRAQFCLLLPVLSVSRRSLVLLCLIKFTLQLWTPLIPLCSLLQLV